MGRGGAVAPKTNKIYLIWINKYGVGRHSFITPDVPILRFLVVPLYRRTVSRRPIAKQYPMSVSYTLTHIKPNVQSLKTKGQCSSGFQRFGPISLMEVLNLNCTAGHFILALAVC